jgi:hypothetical protein
MRLFKVSVLTQMSLEGFGEVDRWLSFHMSLFSTSLTQWKNSNWLRFEHYSDYYIHFPLHNLQR